MHRPSLACQTNFSRAHVAKSTSGDGCQHFVASAGMLAESNLANQVRAAVISHMTTILQDVDVFKEPSLCGDF